jgi:thiol-disulfide isomerase/thioredoxin
LFMDINNLAQGMKFQQDSLKGAFQSVMGTLKMDSLRMDSLSRVFQPVYEKIIDRFSDILAAKLGKNTNMYASLIWLQQLDPEKYSSLYQQMDAELMKKYPHDKFVRAVHDNIGKLMALGKGKEAPDIKLPTPEGKELALSSFRGKVVLVDFWASWCGPCRKEMPNVVKVYNKYKEKGFEIFGVSLDQDMNKWVEAIKNDGITWPQVSDLKFWNSYVVRLYNIEGIPFTVLVDKEGKIIAKGLRGPELEKAVENALSGKDASASL